jgi:hypothetical protein
MVTVTVMPELYAVERLAAMVRAYPNGYIVAG